MRRRAAVSTPGCFLYRLMNNYYVLSSIENVCFPLLHRSSCPILLPTPTNMLVYVRTLLVVVPAAPSLGQVPRCVISFHLTALHKISCSQDKTRTALTMDDLSAALAEYGINARKPEF